MPFLLPREAVVLRAPAPFDAAPRIPGSKSITNRALLLAAIAAGTSTIDGWLDAEDTRLMRAALARLGVAITGPHGDVDEASEAPLVVTGRGGPLAAHGAPALDVGTAGTVARFLLAVLAASPGEVVLDGSARMRERPMAALVDALRSRGARIAALGVADALPLRVGPHAAPLDGGEVRLARPASSQFVSGLVFAALLARAPTRIVLEQGTPARPYVDMTLAIARDFAAVADWDGPHDIVVEPRPLVGRAFVVEPDASAASYVLALAAIRGGRARVALGHASLQGDARFADVLARMGARVVQDAHSTVVEGTGRLEGGRFDLSDMPDMTLTLAVVALFAEGPTRIDGVGILRHHESDRLAAAAAELRKLGATVEVEPDAIVVVPPVGAGTSTARREPVAIDTYGDHRVAMAFSLAGDVEILAPACVAKTYPGYFNALADLGMVVATR
ncbi:MAG TPA: 3-phosphoshikimate 1-carboxyvinyltransferase [Nannocystaceae bacterium]|nr:3-phosphoshikimate 1-carboxyvinyltransferase [Nannocystaceae bacterium]